MVALWNRANHYIFALWFLPSIFRFYSAPQCIASAVLPTAIMCVYLSVRLAVTGRYCVKTTARSTVQFVLSHSKNVSSFAETKKYSPERPLPPEILAQSDLPLLIAASLDTFAL